MSMQTRHRFTLKSTVLAIAVFLVAISFNASANKLTVQQHHAMCSGYHFFWAALARRFQHNNDALFSLKLSVRIDKKWESYSGYTATKNRALSILLNALKQRNSNLIKSFAGVCRELGYPIGRNTRS